MKKKRIKSGAMICKSNNFIDLPMGMRNTTAKLLGIAISKINPFYKDIDFSKHKVKIKFDEFLKHKNQHLDYAKAIMNKLGSIKITIPYNKTEGETRKYIKETNNLSEDAEGIFMFPIMSQTFIDSKNKEINLHFHRAMKPFLIDLDKYTMYALQSVIKFKGKYTWRFYELCWKNYNRNKNKLYNFEYSPDKIKNLLKLKGEFFDNKGKKVKRNKYKQWGEFEKRVLKPSQEELKEKTDDLYFDYKLERGGKGNAVQKIIFINKSKIEKPFKKSKSKEFIYIQKMLLEYNINHNNKDIKILKRYKKNNIEEALRIIDKYRESINNKMGYLIKLLKVKKERGYFNIQDLVDKKKSEAKEIDKMQKKILKNTDLELKDIFRSID